MVLLGMTSGVVTETREEMNESEVLQVSGCLHVLQFCPPGLKSNKKLRKKIFLGKKLVELEEEYNTNI